MKNIESQVIQRGAPKFVPPVAPRIMAVGWQLAGEPRIIVTDEDVEKIFSSVHQTEIDLMSADLEAYQSGEREMIYNYSDEALRTIERDAIGKIDYPF